ASAPAAITLEADAADAEFLDRRQQFKRKRVLDPVLRDDRGDLCFHESAHLFHNGQFLCRQSLSELVKVTVRRRQRLGWPDVLFGRRGWLRCCVLLYSG